MSHRFCTVHNLEFSYPQQLSPLFTDVSLTIPDGWTGIVGANGSGKTTLVRLVLGEIAPIRGDIRAPESCYHCTQTAEAVPPELPELASVPDAEAYRIMELLGIGYDWPYRWETLSFGERKRAQIGAALFLNPDLLVLDEPTNHLDLDAISAVRRALEQYRGIGILISHDRSLLDELCLQCIFLEGGSVTVRPGGVTQGLHEAERERTATLRQRSDARQEMNRLLKETGARKRNAAASDARRSKRHLDRKDSDGRGKINLARVTGKDAVGGKLLRQMDHRIEQANQRIAKATVNQRTELGITIPGSPARRDQFFRLSAQEIRLGEYRSLHAPELEIGPKDRVVLLGPNGSGKSTLLRTILPEISSDRCLYIPQELSSVRQEALRNRFDTLNSKQRGEVLSTVARLGSDPERVLETAQLSPGESRKLLLALGMMDQVEIMVLDEPTNHMDLPSVRCLDDALSNYPAALLVVTHDAQLADHLANCRWVISGKGEKWVLRIESGSVP